VTAAAAAARPAGRWLLTLVLLGCGVLAALDLVSLWTGPPQDEGAAWTIPAGVIGAGFAVGGGAALLRLPALRPARLLLAAGLALLCVPLLSGIGRERIAAVFAALAVAVLTPWALATIVVVHRARRPQQVLLGLVQGSGVATVGCVAAGWTAGAVVGGLVGATAVFCLGWLQFEVTAGADRRRLLWSVLGVCGTVPVVALFLVAADGIPAGPAVIALTAALLALPLPVCAGIALLSPDSRDVRAVISHTVLTVVMLILCVAAFATCATALEAVVGGRPSVGLLGALAAGLAACYHPALVRARGTIDELLFGRRADAVDTLNRLSEHLTSGAAPPEWLESLRSALAVPGLVLRRGAEVLASAGELGDHGTTSVPLRAGDVLAGELVVALPPDLLQLQPTTRAVLHLVAAPLAQAVQAAHLTQELQLSREEVVGVLEEERRRMRRDLHDGLGPTLTGIAYRADAAVNLVRTDPAGGAVAVLRELRADVGEAIAEIRRIVYGLRPKALDELGLVAAVQQRVERLRGPDGRPFLVSTSAPPLPDLPAAVEVVAYRVAVEAVTNVARHAGVDAAQVEITLDGGKALEVRVSDAGCAPGPWREGVGISSMRERVEQIGGVLQVGTGPEGGRVHARLPIR
jgi:signal transduction histidine kinase